MDDGATHDIDAAINNAGRGGKSLPSDVRSYFEPRFGHDFSMVRIHSGADAEKGARAIQARAYTIGAISYSVQANIRPGLLKGSGFLPTN